MKSKICVLITLFMLLIATVCEAATVTIFHTNDMHARVSSADENNETIGLAEISSTVRKAKQVDPNVLWLDAGDTLHGMPGINISLGQNMVTLLNQTPLDATAPGNHDYNYGVKRLQYLAKHLKANVLSANTISIDSDPVSIASKGFVFRPYRIYKLDGIRVGVFGLTTPETAYKSHPKNTEGVQFLNPIDQAKWAVAELTGKCDVIVALMHMGLDNSSEFTSELIAREVPGVDVIIDGHSHTLLPDGMKVGTTLIAQTGCHGKTLGKVSVEVKDGTIVFKRAEILDKSQLTFTPDVKIQKTMAKIEQRNEKLFNTIVAHSDRELTGDRLVVRRQESELGNLCADAFRWRTGADIAVCNGGDLRTSLPAGDVTRRDIMSVMPFGNTIQVAEVSGQVIYEMLEHSVFGYPAAFGGFLNVSGLTFTFDPTLPVGQRVSEVYVNDDPLDVNKTYTLAATDFILAGGDDYTMLKDSKIIGEFETGESMVIDYMNQIGMSGIDSGRIHCLQELDEAA